MRIQLKVQARINDEPDFTFVAMSIQIHYHKEDRGKWNDMKNVEHRYPGLKAPVSGVG